MVRALWTEAERFIFPAVPRLNPLPADLPGAGDPVPTPLPPLRRPGWVGAFLGTVLILAVLAGFIFYRIETLPLRLFDATSGHMEQWAAKARDAFVAVTGIQPRVIVNERVVSEQSSPVLELAVLQREATVERETENTWMGSTKHLRVRGLYRVKAGYDLTRPFTVVLDGAHEGDVSVQTPHARLLSVELEKFDVLTVDNGLWNHVQPEEYEQEVNALNLEARQKAWDEGMLTEAEKMFGAQLQDKLGPGYRLHLVHNARPEDAAAPK